MGQIEDQKLELQSTRSELQKTNKNLNDAKKLSEERKAQIEKLEIEKRDQAQKFEEENNDLKGQLQAKKDREASLSHRVQFASASSSGNGYVWGQCTWYVKNQRPDLPNDLGNGGQWLASAASRGYATGYTPRVGAVAEQAGHVTYVEAVNGGMVTVSEMNYAGGVGMRNVRTVPASTFFGYIYA